MNMKEAFHKADVDNDGVLDYFEFELAFGSILVPSGNNLQIKKLFLEIDVD